MQYYMYVDVRNLLNAFAFLFILPQLRTILLCFEWLGISGDFGL